MFTGIIEQLGKVMSVSHLDGGGLILNIETGFDDIKAGESIAINGVCLTALGDSSNTLSCHVSQESLNVTTLANIESREIVNVERAMMAGDRFGGHVVTGHVDTTAEIIAINTQGDFVFFELANFHDFARAYLVKKGSVALDGVSLTINEVTDSGISLAIIPHTLANTNIKNWRLGTTINVEFDYLAKVIAHQVSLFNKEVEPC